MGGVKLRGGLETTTEDGTTGGPGEESVGGAETLGGVGALDRGDVETPAGGANTAEGEDIECGRTVRADSLAGVAMSVCWAVGGSARWQ